jgi:hypothetical protein
MSSRLHPCDDCEVYKKRKKEKKKKKRRVPKLGS